MKKLFKIVILLMFLSLCTFAKELTFVQITDLNLNETNVSKACALIREINQRKNIDFVVFTGNNLKKASLENLDLFTLILKKINKKTYVLLGNQDVLSSSGVDKEYYYSRVSRALKKHSKKPNFTFEKKGYVFVAMDGSKQFFQSSNGYYTKNELMWLNKTLDENKDKKVIILQHFPLLKAEAKWNETKNTEEYNEILANYTNIKAIVSGHFNKNIEQYENNILHIITQSASNNWAYKIIQIDLNDDFISTYLVK